MVIASRIHRVTNISRAVRTIHVAIAMRERAVRSATGKAWIRLAVPTRTERSTRSRCRGVCRRRSGSGSPVTTRVLVSGTHVHEIGRHVIRTSAARGWICTVRTDVTECAAIGGTRHPRITISRKRPNRAAARDAPTISDHLESLGRVDPG